MRRGGKECGANQPLAADQPIGDGGEVDVPGMQCTLSFRLPARVPEYVKEYVKRRNKTHVRRGDFGLRLHSAEKEADVHREKSAMPGSPNESAVRFMT